MERAATSLATGVRSPLAASTGVSGLCPSGAAAALGGDAASRRRQRGQGTAPRLGAPPADHQPAPVVTVGPLVCVLPIRLLPPAPFRRCGPGLPRVSRTPPTTPGASPRPRTLPTRTYGQRGQRAHTQTRKYIHAQAHARTSTHAHTHVPARAGGSTRAASPRALTPCPAPWPAAPSARTCRTPSAESKPPAGPSPRRGGSRPAAAAGA